VRHPEPFLNDSVLHFGLIRALASAAERGQSWFDPWVPTCVMGFPVFHYYQNLPHLTVVALAKATFGVFSLVETFKIVEWLAIGTFPIPVFLAMRKFGFDRGASLTAAALSLAVKTNYLHGHDLESYVWQGLGQYTQAFGGWFVPLALAWTYDALRHGRGYAKATLLLAVTFLSHLALGYMAFLCAGILALLTPREIPRRVVRLTVVAGVAIAACAYVIVPIFRDFAYYNVSTLVPSWKYNSFGHAVVLPWLLRGELFDFERLGIAAGGRSFGAFPILTVLVGIGFVAAFFQARRNEAARFLVVAFVVSFALFCGRPTWGKLLNLLPLGSGFHYSRAIYVVHLTGVMLAGVGLAGILRLLSARGTFGRIGAVVFAALVLVPLGADRTAYLLRSARLVRGDAAEYAAVRDDLEATLAFARSDRNGRAYAGQGAAGSMHGWGGRFLVGHCPVYSWFPAREMDALGYLYHMWSHNSDLHDEFNEGRLADYRVFNVRKVVAPIDGGTPPFAREVFRSGPFRVLDVPGPGFVELVRVPYAIDVAKRDLSRLQRQWLRGPLPAAGVHPEIALRELGGTDSTAIPFDSFDFEFPSDSDSGADSGSGSGSDSGSGSGAGSGSGSGEGSDSLGIVRNVERAGEDFTVVVDVRTETHLLLKESYHPGWKATLDGEPVTTVQLMPSYVGVRVTPGRHEIVFRYAPGPLPAFLAAFGVVLLISFFALESRLRL
jgi:hypothetical protein